MTDSPRYTVTLPVDEEPLVALESVEDAIGHAQIFTEDCEDSFEQGVVIRDHGRVVIRARGGRAWWVRECEVCHGRGSQLCSGPCRGTGLVEDRPC